MGYGSFGVYRRMINVSKISPLLFDVRYNDIEIDREYVQRFADSETITVQCVVSPSTTLTMYLFDLCANDSFTISPISYDINDSNKLLEFIIPRGGSLYQATITGSDGHVSSVPFRFCDREELSGLAEISYTNRDNITSFGAVFKVGGNQRTFKLWVEGGFKSDGHSLSVSNEQFRTQGQEIIELYAVPYQVDTLTIGDNEGVPFEMARLFNNILCLSDVKINGVRYVRSESSVPERQVIAERYPLFNYTLNLERAENVSFNGFTEQADGSWVTGTISVNVVNAKDGQVLVYDDSAGAFVNQSNLDSL